MDTALAYLNWGRWVADCPAPGCTDAREVYQNGVRLDSDTCARGHHFQIEMPPERMEAQIVTALADRVEDADKGWYPKGHERAILTGQPTGQTIAELVAENDEVAAYRTAHADATKEQVREALAAAGIEVRPDGSFEGVL